MQPDEHTKLLGVASKTTCICGSRAAVSLFKAAQTGCLRCCSEHIHEAGKLVKGTTALVVAAKNGRLDVVRLLLPLEGRIKDGNGRPIWYHLAKAAREAFDEVLEALETELYVLIREMREMPCLCYVHSTDIAKAIENHCMRCCASCIAQAHQFIDKAAAEVRAAKDTCLAPVKLMVYLQAKFKAGAGAIELIYAVHNNLYDAAVLLVDEQRDLMDGSGRKASIYAASVHNPRLWSLFPEDITEAYAADLAGAHSSECRCEGGSGYLFEAVDRGCLKCCARFVWGGVSGVPGVPRYTELMLAQEKRHHDIVRLLAHTQAGIQDRRGRSALMMAVLSDSPAAVALLACREASLQDSSGRTALDWAALRNRPGLIEILQGQDGAQVGSFDTGGAQKRHAEQHNNDAPQYVCDTPAQHLLEAAAQGCLSCCEKFKAQIGNTFHGQTAMMAAAQAGSAHIVEFLMGKEARIQDMWRQTAAMYAAENGRLEVVKLLMPLEKDLKDRDNRTLCVFAARSKHEATLEHVLREMRPGAYESLLEARKAPCTCKGTSKNLLAAARSGCLACASSFVHEVGDTREGPAIVHAVWKGHTNIVRFLIPFEAGLREDRDTTALMQAVENGHAEIIKTLKSEKIGLPQQQGATALIQAVLYRRRDCFDLLRQCQAELDATQIHPVVFAVYDRDFKAIAENKNRLNAVVEKGLKVLDFALLRGRLTFQQFLSRDPKMRQELAEYYLRVRWGYECMCLRFLSNTESQRLFQTILDVVCCCGRNNRSMLFSKALFRFPGPATRLLRPFCAPVYSDIRHALEYSENKAADTIGFQAIKNVAAGCCFTQRHTESLNFLYKNEALFAGNPLKLKQFEIAKKQAEKLCSKTQIYYYSEEQEYWDYSAKHSYYDGAPDKRNFGWRETEAEAFFNRYLLLEARCNWWKIIVAEKQIIPTPKIPLKSKLARNAVVITNAYRYFYQKVQEMLDE